MNALEMPVVIDDFLDPQLFDRLAQLFQDTSWKFGWRSNTVGDSLLHWNKHIAGGGKSSRTACDSELSAHEEGLPVAEAWAAIKEQFLQDHSLVRCYANAHTFGLDGSIHRDNPKDVPMVTTLVYCHRFWPLPWGGETLFYSDDCESITATTFPKPGRIAMFHGSMPHAARSPTRLCRELRVSLVFKSMKADALL
jgi:SM-20-related protein